MTRARRSHSGIRRSPPAAMRRSPSGSAVLFVVSLLVAGAARAQESGDDLSTAQPERLYLGSTTLLGSSRVLALGGAYVAIAEGASGIPQNLAALAHRRQDLDRDYDVGITASLLELAVTPAEQRDMDNDGR